MRLYYYFLPSVRKIKRRRGDGGAHDYRELLTCHKAQITSATRARRMQYACPQRVSSENNLYWMPIAKTP